MFFKKLSILKRFNKDGFKLRELFLWNVESIYECIVEELLIR